MPDPVADPSLPWPPGYFTPGTAPDPNYYDPFFNPYGEPTPPVQPDFTPLEPEPIPIPRPLPSPQPEPPPIPIPPELPELPPIERDVTVVPGVELEFPNYFIWDREGLRIAETLRGTRRIRSIAERELFPEGLRAPPPPKPATPTYGPLPPALRESTQLQLQAPRGSSNARRPAGRARSGRTRLRDRNPALDGALGFVARTTPRTVPRIDQPGGAPGTFGWPFPITIPRRERRATPREMEELREGRNPFPQPQPDINPNVPQRPPRVLPPSTSPPELPLPVPELVPALPPQIPEPTAPVVLPPPVQSPPPPIISPPRPPRAPSRAKPPPNPLQRIIRIGAPGLAAASILRPILRRRRQQTTSPLRQFTAPFDPLPQPIGDPVAQVVSPVAPVAPVAPVSPIADPFTPRLDLTDDYSRALRLSETTPQTRRRTSEEECKCEETEEEKELRRRPSRVLAKVKAFTRRMSQNSLDNLR